MHKIDNLFQLAFRHNKPFRRKSREVKVVLDVYGYWLSTVGVVHRNPIIKKDLTGMYIRDAGWRTRLTLKTIRGCLPAGCSFANWSITRGNCTTIPTSNRDWTMVPVKDQWGVPL